MKRMGGSLFLIESLIGDSQIAGNVILILDSIQKPDPDAVSVCGNFRIINLGKL